MLRAHASFSTTCIETAASVKFWHPEDQLLLQLAKHAIVKRAKYPADVLYDVCSHRCTCHGSGLTVPSYGARRIMGDFHVYHLRQ